MQCNKIIFMIFPQHFLNVIYVTIESSSKFIFYIHLFRYTHDCKSSFTSHYEPQYRKRRLYSVQDKATDETWENGDTCYRYYASTPKNYSKCNVMKTARPNRLND